MNITTHILSDDPPLRRTSLPDQFNGKGHYDYLEGSREFSLEYDIDQYLGTGVE
jgi:hypothetical protein